MILTVTPNPALDLTWEVGGLEPGETHRVESGMVRAGGKGVNVARVLHAVGEDVRALTTTGGASGESFAAEIARSGVPATLVPVMGATRRSVAVVDRRSGAATLLNEHGAPLSPGEVAALLDAARTLGSAADAVAISGSLPPGLTSQVMGDVVAFLRAHDVPVVADLAGDALLAAARAGASALKPNRDELSEATREDDPLTAARHLIALGAGIVVASLGADGLLVVGPDRSVRARLPRAFHGNATGAGDAAVAAIVLELAGMTRSGCTAHTPVDLERLARRAAAWSASAVLMPLAGDLHPHRRALEREVQTETQETA